ncbi:UrcA family protein [Povalibacter sp.]|uniref:UrcA family protein n=1 Tax=Povalibacter sp. TaxID=1962978 RepID=UPI002F3F5D85
MNERSIPFKRVLQGALLSAVSCCALTGVAAAAPAAPRQVTVHYGDLNLSTDVGAKQLYGRIRAAARAVCGAPDGLVPLTVISQHRQCTEEAVAAAVQKVDNGILTAMHNGKSLRRFG